MKLTAILLALLVATQAQELDPKTLETSVVAAANGSTEEQRHMEDQLLARLAQASSQDEKALICRLLRRIGSARSVSALAAMLGDAELSHAARFALASIPGPESAKAMREALSEVPEPLQAGLMASLAARGDSESLALIAERLPAKAAIQALGVFGSRESARALAGLRDSKEGIGYFDLIDDAMLKCAERLLAQGKRADARELYLRVLSSNNLLAGIQGLAKINDLHAKTQVERALAHEDEVVQLTALRAMIRMLGDEAVSTMVAYLPMAPLPQQLVIIDWLGKEGNGSARAPLTDMARSARPAVRLEAVRALGSIGDASTVPFLLGLMHDQDKELRAAAQASLVRLEGDDVREKLLEVFRSEPSKSLISLLAARRERAALPDLLAVSDRSLLGASLKAAGSLASASELPAFVKMLTDPAMGSEIKTIESAILSTFREIPDPGKRAAPLLAQYEESNVATKIAIVNLLGRTGASEALAVVRGALQSEEPSLVNAAVHTLARWATAEPIDDLHTIAASTENDGHRVVALRGYVNMARNVKDAAARFEQAATLAKTPEDKRLVLSGLGRVGSLEALKVCQSFLEEPKVSTEAALACLQIARRAWRQSPDEMNVLVKSFLQHEDGTVRENAEAVLERMAQ